MLVKELVPGVLQGKNWCFYGSTAEEACRDEAASAAFDATFPPKEQGWRKEQEQFYIMSHAVIVQR